MIWVIGYKGMLGTEVVKQLQEKKLSWVGTDIEVDISDYTALESFTKSIKTASYFPSQLSKNERQINWIINCAAYTNVKKAEDNIEQAEKINTFGSLNIARICRKIGAKLIHISTDYVFDGKSNTPYTEDEFKTPLNVYGKTKAAGEEAIQKEMNTYYIIRTSWLYGINGNNFVKTIINKSNTEDNFSIINDQFGTPTNAQDLAEVIIKFIDRSVNASGFFGKNSIPAYGIYNFTNNGQTNWFEFAQEIYKLGKKYKKINNECKITSCTSLEYNDLVIRPSYSVLDKSKICKELKIKLVDWKVSSEKLIKSTDFSVLN